MIPAMQSRVWGSLRRSARNSCRQPAAAALTARFAAVCAGDRNSGGRGTSQSATPGERLSGLRRLIQEREIVRAIEVHSGLCGLIAEKARATRPDGSEVAFDAMWSSSLTSSASKGKPDIETVSTAERLRIVEDAMEVCSKPLVYDGDTGGLPEIFHFTVRTLERLGVSAVVIEDKAGLKRNSLFGIEKQQLLEAVDVFCDKIRAGQAAKVTEDFMIISRLEALIAGFGQEEALARAKAYIEAGTDAIMIHSKEKDPDEVLAFLARYNRFEKKVPIVAVPTTYSTLHETELAAAGANICIYANQLIRASYPAMMDVAQSILAHGRAKEVDAAIMPAKRLISTIDDHSGVFGKAAPPTAAATTGIGTCKVNGYTGPSELPAEVTAPLTVESFFALLRTHGVGFFAGVPDSLLKHFCAYLADAAADMPDVQHTITANEGASIAAAAGYHMATGGVPLVYMQNSGLGNAVNPLLSLADPQVYSIPMLLLIGWRGEPGKKDEPQHRVMGEVMPRMLSVMGIPYAVLPSGAEQAEVVLEGAYRSAVARSAPFALLVKAETFAAYKARRLAPTRDFLLREQVLQQCLRAMGSSDVAVGTTGYTSREIFELREAASQGHARDFLTVGSMGHASLIALGIAQAQPSRRVICFDGDGALLMHMGSMATLAQSGCANLKHVVINNMAHDSVGAQPTGMGAVDIPGLARAIGYRWAQSANSGTSLEAAFGELLHAEGPALLEVMAKPGARKDLGRPTTSPGQNKEAFMGFLAEDKRQEDGHGSSRVQEASASPRCSPRVA